MVAREVALHGRDRLPLAVGEHREAVVADALARERGRVPPGVHVGVEGEMDGVEGGGPSEVELQPLGEGLGGVGGP